MSRILVVDDNDSLRSEVVSILTFEGHEVFEAGNGRQGLTRVEEVRPDVVVCDLMMPELDGYGMLEALRNDPTWETLPFVLLTARADREGMRHGMEIGAHDYVTKPFTAEELLGAIEAALERQRRADRKTDEQLSTLRSQVSLTLPHELRTPLNVIMGFAELLTEADAPGESMQVPEIAGRILEAARRLHRLTENSLLFAQLELLSQNGNGSLSYEGSPMLLNPVVAAVAMRSSAAVDRKSDLQLELQDVWGNIEEASLQKLVGELIDNAFKFSEPGSKVIVSSQLRGGCCEIAVLDEGLGMTPEQIDSIAAFRQFGRDCAEQQGLGLGLSIASRLARLWGGKLEIESRAGGGTMVRLELPVAVPVAAQPSSHAFVN